MSNIEKLIVMFMLCTCLSDCVSFSIISFDCSPCLEDFSWIHKLACLSQLATQGILNIKNWGHAIDPFIWPPCDQPHYEVYPLCNAYRFVSCGT